MCFRTRKCLNVCLFLGNKRIIQPMLSGFVRMWIQNTDDQPNKYDNHENNDLFAEYVWIQIGFRARYLRRNMYSFYKKELICFISNRLCKHMNVTWFRCGSFFLRVWHDYEITKIYKTHCHSTSFPLCKRKPIWYTNYWYWHHYWST